MGTQCIVTERPVAPGTPGGAAALSGSAYEKCDLKKMTIIKSVNSVEWWFGARFDVIYKNNSNRLSALCSGALYAIT